MHRSEAVGTDIHHPFAAQTQGAVPAARKAEQHVKQLLDPHSLCPILQSKLKLHHLMLSGRASW